MKQSGNDKGQKSIPRDQKKALEISREARRQSAIERLGVNKPVCLHCGEDNPVALQKHHVAGRKSHEVTCTVCATCHCKLTDRQKDEPQELYKDTRHPLEVIAHLLWGLAEFFESLIHILREFAIQLFCYADEDRLNCEPSS